MQLTKQVKEVVNGIADYGIYQHEYMFPWMDSFLFYRRDSRDDYETSTPEYQDNRDDFLGFFRKVGKQYKTPPLFDIMTAKHSGKGLHIPSKDATIIYALKGDIRILVSENFLRLLHTVAIYDYDLYNYKSRNIKLNVITEGSIFVIGNRYAHCLHMEEGQEVLYARYS